MGSGISVTATQPITTDVDMEAQSGNQDGTPDDEAMALSMAAGNDMLADQAMALSMATAMIMDDALIQEILAADNRTRQDRKLALRLADA